MAQRTYGRASFGEPELTPLKAVENPLPAIAVGAKTNSTASDAGLTEFGYYHPGFGGGVIVEGAAGSELAVVARVATKDATDPFGMVAEDYNGMPTP